MQINQQFTITAPNTAHRYHGDMKVKVVAIANNNTVTIRALTGNFGRSRIYAQVPVTLLTK